MNSRKATRAIPGFTLIELLLVISIIGILAALLLPVLSQGQKKARRAQCVSDLKEVGLAFHSFMHDHNSLFPMQVSTNNGGTLELMMASYQVAGGFYFQYRHFQVLSNELNTPRLLYCPADRARVAAADFVEFSNVNVSYFVGANAEYDNPNSILAGDRNITDAAGVSGSIMRLADGVMLNWTGEMHEFKGNVLYADGRVAELNRGLQWAANDTSQVMDLINPALRPVGSLATPAAPPQPPLYPPPAFVVAQSLSISSTRQSTLTANNNARPPATASAPASTPTWTSPWAIPLRSSSERSTPPARLATNTSANAQANTNAGAVTNVGVEKAMVTLANTPIVPPPAAVNRLWWLLLLLLCLLLLVWRIARRRSPEDADAEGEDA